MNFDKFQAKLQKVLKGMSPQHLTNLFKSLKGGIRNFMAKHKAKIEHIVFQGG